MSRFSCSPWRETAGHHAMSPLSVFYGFVGGLQWVAFHQR